MLAYFAEEAESIARMAYYLRDDINYAREYAYGIDTDNYYDYYDNYKVSVAVTDLGGGGHFSTLLSSHTKCSTPGCPHVRLHALSLGHYPTN